MGRLGLLLVAFGVVCTAGASWYWPFGGSDAPRPPRVSELMEPATELIDAAADAAEDGDIDKAVATYRQALDELARIEMENPDRADKPEFATLRNKRAYVNAAIDSLLLAEARKNSSGVAITDTTELERAYAKRQADARAARSGRRPGPVNDDTRFVNEGLADGEGRPRHPNAGRPGTDRRARLQAAMEALRRGEHDASLLIIRELLAERPNDAAALNLRARVEAAAGDTAAAERTLDQCIQSNPRSYYAYYNLARLILQTRGAPGREAAARYYARGREIGGPRDGELEEAVP